MKRHLGAVLVGILGMGAAAGCVVKQEDGVEKFREPLPVKDDVSVAVPSGGASTQALSTQGSGGGSGTGYAEFYQFTRDVTDAVDAYTLIMLGGVWLIVHTPPASVSSNRAVWGPGQGNALDPVVWRFTVVEVEPGVFEYALEGRPKDSRSDGDFKAVLKGHGYGKSHANHRNGWFTLDRDAHRALDPARAKDSGTIRTDYDARKWPIAIDVEVKPTETKEWLKVGVVHQQDKGGTLDITGLVDIDPLVKDGKLEDVALKSRWASTGAGRADVAMNGGSLPVTVSATECWSSSFAQVYYADSVNHKPTKGDKSACAF